MTKKNIDQTIYTDDSIISLDPRAFTRLRPSTYLGSNEYSTQLVREIFSNSLDEFLIGHGNKITVTIDTKYVYIFSLLKTKNIKNLQTLIYYYESRSYFSTLYFQKNITFLHVIFLYSFLIIFHLLSHS